MSNETHVTQWSSAASSRDLGFARYFRITCVVLDKNRPESNLFYICVSVFICKMSRHEKHQGAFIPSLYSHVFSSIFSLIDAKGKSTMPSWLSAFQSKTKKTKNNVSCSSVSWAAPVLEYLQGFCDFLTFPAHFWVPTGYVLGWLLIWTWKWKYETEEKVHAAEATCGAPPAIKKSHTSAVWQ